MPLFLSRVSSLSLSYVYLARVVCQCGTRANAQGLNDRWALTVLSLFRVFITMRHSHILVAARSHAMRMPMHENENTLWRIALAEPMHVRVRDPDEDNLGTIRVSPCRECRESSPRFRMYYESSDFSPP